MINLVAKVINYGHILSTQTINLSLRPSCNLLREKFISRPILVKSNLPVKPVVLSVKRMKCACLQRMSLERQQENSGTLSFIQVSR